MIERGDQGQPATPAADASAAAGEAKTPPPSPAAEQRVHLYEAVSARRDQVLNQFSGQRAAILKAVADQRAAAVAPILAVAAKRANESRAAEPASAAMSADPAVAPGMTPPPLGNAAIGGATRRRSLTQLRRAVAADIVSTIRALVAAEVRAQLAAAEPAAKPASDPRRAMPAESEAAGEGASSTVE
jgi:hypothetical protein